MIEEEVDKPDMRNPSRFRRALCELSGGHSSELLEAWGWKDGCVFSVGLYCRRCGYSTRWFPIQHRPPEEGLSDLKNVVDFAAP